MASPTQWTWVWVSSGSWWWTGKSGVLQSMGSQRVGHNWVTELNWSDPHPYWENIHSQLDSHTTFTKISRSLKTPFLPIFQHLFFFFPVFSHSTGASFLGLDYSKSFPVVVPSAWTSFSPDLCMSGAISCLRPPLISLGSFLPSYLKWPLWTLSFISSCLFILITQHTLQFFCLSVQYYYHIFSIRT